MNKNLLCLIFSLAACRRPVVGGEELLPPTDEAAAQCAPLTTCNGVAELLPLLVPLLPSGPQGAAGKDGLSGATVEEVIAATLPLLPPGAKGDKGDPGAMGQSASVWDVVNAVLPLLPPGPQGLPGPVGLQGGVGAPGAQGEVGPAGATGAQGVPGVQGNVGSQGNVGPTGLQGDVGAQGPAGVGLSNVSTLSAVRVYSPAVADFKGVISVNSSAVFVPRSLKVVEGSQGVGFATLEFGSVVCTYQGNNKSVDANASYVLLSCKDSTGVVLPDMVPGKSFAFTGSITLSIGLGASTSEATQAVAFLQIQ